MAWYTKQLAASMLGKWVIRAGIIESHKMYKMYKCIDICHRSHRVKVIPFGEDKEITLRTRKFRPATEEEVARIVALRVTTTP